MYRVPKVLCSPLTESEREEAGELRVRRARVLDTAEHVGSTLSLNRSKTSRSGFAEELRM